MIEVKNISYQIGSKVLLQDVSVVFQPDKLNLIIGPNGAGKSTLVKIISNQLQPKQGDVCYGGKNIRHLSIPDLARIRSVLSQNIEIAFPLTVHEVVMMGRYPHFSSKPKQEDLIACEEAMRFFDVLEMAERNYMTLSGGEKQRVHFARVTAQVWYPTTECRYLILDEPLTFLDVHYQFDFMKKIMLLIQKGNLVAVGVVHDLNLASKFADQITLIHQGKLIANGTKEVVLTKENIRQAYSLTPVIHHYKEEMHLFFE